MWKTTGKVLLAAVLFLVLNLLVSAGIGLVAAIADAARNAGNVTPESITELLQSNPWLRTASFALSAASGVATAAILYYAMERERTWTLGWRQRDWLPKGLLGLALGALLIVLAFLIAWIAGGIAVVDAVLTSDVVVALLFDVVLFASVAVGEEVFSRGYVYGVVRRSGGVVAAVVASSALFALFHMNNPAVLSNAFPMLNLVLAGVMLALLREWSGGLWAPIGAHLTWNFVQGDVLGMAVSGVETPSILRVESLNDFVSGGAFGLEGSFAVTLVTAGASLWLALAIRKRGASASAGLS
ncbi:CPBP family intramembrane glutamic endopeptidase [Paenibacillus sp.]|uniref:CPBP family intramembrane glutamic endopeptidase n=1 Tax=Paenibacillus sp. TaxID=58172 RepID=UPI0028111B22|nr:CPBP family intramembrane glutamic endopeptidase [Paenibacillus sp.]